jgi:translation initiation factor IF-3
LGIFPLHEAINLAKAQGVDLVEIAPSATPPVCRVVDYGKFRYEQAKKDKEAKRHQHATKVKEVQLSCSIDPHDLDMKMQHGVEFLCEDMKLKITLRYRGIEMMHKELGFQVVEKFLHQVHAYGHPDAEPKLLGKGITVMVSPLPRNKRPKGPTESGAPPIPADNPNRPKEIQRVFVEPPNKQQPRPNNAPASGNQPGNSGGFLNNPFEQLEIKVGR